MITKRLVIIGGGPAGLAAAISSYDCGVEDVLILERESSLGGILNQCIHNGFGLHTFKEELTGPEYALKYIDEVNKRNINYLLDTTVIDVTEDKIITALNSKDGLIQIKCEAIILACGCRERPRGQINIAGSRPAGVFSAGTAQKLVNIDGLNPGNEVVILGSGDIGLIMARRMTFMGAKVKCVCELMPYSSGLNRNIVQCLEDFNIPLKFSHTVIEILGKDRLTGVKIAKVDQNLNPIMETAEVISCDTLLLSVGLIPENELAKKANVNISPVTNGAKVDDSFMTNVDGIFQCGNVLHVHDLVDFVSSEAANCAKCAVSYLNNELYNCQTVDIECLGGVRYVVPHAIRKDQNYSPINLKFRVGNVYKNVYIVVTCDGEVIYKKKKQICTPGEMENINLDEKKVKILKNSSKVTVELRKEQK